MTSVRSSHKSSRGPDRAEALEGMQADYRGTLADDQEKLVLVTSVQQLQHELKVSLTYCCISLTCFVSCQACRYACIMNAMPNCASTEMVIAHKT